MTYTFARYTNTATGTNTVQVAPWIVKVNETDITASNTFTASEINWSDSAHIAEGYAAPGRSGEFYLSIDPTGSKVSMEYEITIDSSDFADYGQISIHQVMNTDDGTVLSPNGDGTYTGKITLDEIEDGTVHNYRVVIVWSNSDTYNESDTEIGTTLETIQIPVTVTASQYIS